MQERGRAYKDKLDQISNEYAALHALFKRLIKSEEEYYRSREQANSSWTKLAEIEESPALGRAFEQYAEATGLAGEAHSEALGQLRDVVQEALRVYSVRLKQQRRSLSRIGRTDAKAEAELGPNIEQFEGRHVEDMKQLLLHLINAEMYYHAKALQALSERYEVFHSIDRE